MLSIIRHFFQFCGVENRRKFTLSLFLGVGDAFFNALKIPAIAVMLKALLASEIRMEDIFLSLGIMLLSILGISLIKSKSMMLQTEAGYDTCARKRVEIAEHLRYLPMGYFNQNSLGQISSVATNTMQMLENVATRVIMQVSEGLLTTSLIILMLFFFDYRIALVLLTGFVLFLFCNSALQKAAGKLSGRKIEAEASLVEKVLEYLQGMAEVKAYHLSGEKSRELNEAIHENAQINTEMELSFIPIMALQSLIAKLSGVAMVLFSCLFYCAGSMSALNAIIMAISAFIVNASLESAGSYSALLRIVEMSVDRAEELAFSYDQRLIIDGVSLEIPEHTTTAIVGPSGSGKTTLVSLLSRFWDPEKGRVLLGARNVRDYDMDSLMAKFSFVFQNVYLFHDSILNNIRFARPEASLEEVIAVSKKACCHDFITALPNGYDTVIGEGGASLSGGEKQRISIARAMMKDSPVIFLDEATANVDPENENELMRAISFLTNEKTVILIAHRLKTVSKANQILVLDHGRIVQSGSHEELLKENGIYRDFIQERKEAVSWKVRK